MEFTPKVLTELRGKVLQEMAYTEIAQALALANDVFNLIF